MTPNPALCLVFSYCFVGFPSPAITYIFFTLSFQNSSETVYPFHSYFSRHGLKVPFYQHSPNKQTENPKVLRLQSNHLDYSSKFSQKRFKMVAICALVAVPAGFKSNALFPDASTNSLPLIRPTATAHFTASFA